jgi:DNA invertase Pin-like site-specific DNA recombinase
MNRLDPRLFGRLDKIRRPHLERLAVVYVRQSTQRQVLENRESTDLQYKLTRKAEELGWRPERVLVIDDDLGHSGSSAVDRAGFQRLLAEVGLNHVGLILGSEMSRLARSCKDWYQLLELAAVFGVLIADQDGIYDPGEYNDRLLLGLKGTMSEAELHVLRGRLLQGKRNKAERGELFSHPPVGYARLPDGTLGLDPDEQARDVVRLVFAKFAEFGSARQVMLYLNRNDIRLPVRTRGGLSPGELQWRVPVPATVYNILRHPMYAGAYCYGRSQVDPRRQVPGRPQSGRVRTADGQWQVLLPGRLPAYISWEQYLANRERLHDNRSSFESRGAPRSGPALLSGLVACARCGWRMVVHYRGGSHIPRYVCRGYDPSLGRPDRCPTLAARVVDDLISRLVLEALRPAAIELSLAAAEDMLREAECIEMHWKQRLERARFQAERARRQFDAAEPENRLVAREFERRWEEALREEQQLAEDYARSQRERTGTLTDEDRRRVRALASDIPALWESAGPADRQEIIRHLVERVEVDVAGHSEHVTVTVLWAGGGISVHRITKPVGSYEQLHDFQRLSARIRELKVAGKQSGEIATSLNAEGYRAARGDGRFTTDQVRQVVSRLGLGRPRPGTPEAEARLRTCEVWMTELAYELGIPIPTLTAWCRKGWVHARKVPTPDPRWAVRVDRAEKDRLQRLQAARVSGIAPPYPVSLTTPRSCRKAGVTQRR